MSGAAPRGARIVAAGAWLALWLGFAWCIGLGTWGRWYSPSIAHRLQTDAFFHGTFALQPTPYGQMADWAWGNGSQHVWGLGVALWRFPLECLARVVGAAAFPDRVALLLAFVAATLVCARAFRDVAPWERIALTVVMVAPPAFVTLCRTRLAVYEESVAYAHLVAVTMAGLLLSFAGHRRAHDLVAACGLAGVAPFFRPTLVFDAAVTVGLGLALTVAAGAPRGERRWATAGIASTAFAAGLALVGFVGWRRFGSPFETGQLLNVSYIPTDQAAKLFGYPFRDEPFRRAVAELVSSLVLPARWNAPRWYATAIHPWQSATVRFREFYFTPFTVWQLLLLLGAWAAIAAVAVAARRAPRERRWIAAPVGVAALWSVLAFVCQVAFYLWAPSMTSRYAVDLAAPLGVGASALLLMGLRAADAAPPEWAARLRVIATCVALAWLGHDVAAAEIAPSHRQTPLLDASGLAAALRRPVPDARPLPTAYRCGDAPEDVGIKFNGSGWATPGTCEVHAATMLFVPTATCVRLQVAPAVGAAALTPEQTATVRAKLGLSEMRRVADVADGPGRALDFCVLPDHRPNPRGIELLYLGWVRPADLSPDVRPFRLLAVAEVATP